MRLIDADKAYKILTEYYHHRTEIQHKALEEAFDRVPIVFSEVDLIEIEDRFGYFVRAIIEDMISGKNNRWSTKWCEEMLDAESTMGQVKPSDKEFTLYAEEKPIVTFKDSKIVLHGERKEDVRSNDR